MRKKDVKEVKDIELYYTKARKIKFEDSFEVKKIEDIKILLFEEQRETLYRRNGKHCKREKQRSFNDFFLLCKSYFPEKTIKQIVNELIKIEKKAYKADRGIIAFRFCPNIRKHNVSDLYNFLHPFFSNIIENKSDKLELGFKDRYSINDLK